MPDQTSNKKIIQNQGCDIDFTPNSSVDEIIDTSAPVTVYEKWDEYGLKKPLLQAIYSVGFETPSFIQKTAIMPIILGRDVRAQAQSGTGKTAAFGVAALQKLTDEKVTQVLILVNTIEVAEQNAIRIRSLAQNMSVKITILAGGVDIPTTRAELLAGSEIVVGTPGRVFHMIRDGFLNTKNISLLIIDEADEMLSSGFHDQLSNIFSYLDPKMQVAMFSATWEKREMEIASKILSNPVVIDLRLDEQTLKGIEQYYVLLGDRKPQNSDNIKIGSLIEILSKNNIGQCVLFVNSRNKAKYVFCALRDNNIPVEMIHSDLDKSERKQVMERFRMGTSRLLVSTGVLGRGVDVQKISLVINFDLPKFTSTDGPESERRTDLSSYLHRIGRAGRFGRKGKALNLIFSDEIDTLKEITEHYRTNIMPLPQNFDLS